MARHKLPIYAERSVGDVQAKRLELASRHENGIRGTGTKISCTSGCAACCHHPIRISVLEGMLLFKYLVARGQWAPSFKMKLTEHSDLTKHLAVEVWFLSNTPCPLLNEKQRCIGYEARPFQCRSTFSIGDPYYCHPHRIAEGNSKMVSRVEVLEEFHKEEATLLRRHGLWHIVMPISTALLLAERIMTGVLDLENADRTFLADYKAGA